MKENKLAINIKIAEGSVRLFIDPGAEQFYRDAGRYLKNKMTAYNYKFSKLQTERLINRVSCELAVLIIRNFTNTPSLTANALKGYHPFDSSFATSIKQKNALLYRGARIYLIDCRSYYSKKYPTQKTAMLSMIVAFHLAVEIQRIKCTCIYCGKLFDNTYDLKDNYCPSHPDGPMKGKHETAYSEV